MLRAIYRTNQPSSRSTVIGRVSSTGVVRKDGTGCEEDDRTISTAIPLSADRATSIGRMREILTDIADACPPPGRPTAPAPCLSVPLHRRIPGPAVTPPIA